MPEAIPWDWILSIAGGITILIGAGSAVLKLFAPYKAVRARIDKHDVLLEKDNQRLKREEDCTTVMMEALFALLEHARTNNSTGLMDAASKKLQQFLIERKGA